MDTKILPPRCAQCSIILTSRINIFPCGHSSFCINCLHLHYRSSSLCPSCATPSRAYGAHPVSQLHPPSSPLSSNTSFVINNNNTSDLKIRISRAGAGSVSPSQPPSPPPFLHLSPHRPLPVSGVKGERRAVETTQDVRGGEWVPGSVEEEGEEVKRWGRGWGAD